MTIVKIDLQKGWLSTISIVRMNMDLKSVQGRNVS